MMQQTPVDSNILEVMESPYYKKIQKELKQKAIKKVDEEKQQTTNGAHTAESNPIEDVYHSSDFQKTKVENEIDSDKFNDKVRLTADQLFEELDEQKQQKTKDKQATQERARLMLDNMRYNGKEIMRNLAYKIDFAARKDEFKEIFKFNLQQSRSENSFVARFSQFKVGIVGQILTGLGIQIEELKKLKKQAFKEVFDENLIEMQENIYNTELTEIIHGKKRRTKRALRMFGQLKSSLITKMNNIGRVGYWSQSRLLEEQLRQCKRILEEFTHERDNLTYLLAYYQQEQDYGE